MLIGIVIKNVDKQLPGVLCHLFHQSRSLKNKGTRIKNRFPQLSFQNNFTNILNSILEKQSIWDPYAEVKNYLKDNACGSNNAIITLMSIFQIKRSTAKSILIKYPIFAEFPKKRIIDSYQLLKNAGMSLPIIHTNVKLLTQDINILKKKITIIQSIVSHLDYGVYFFYHNLDSLNKFMKLMIKVNNQSLKNLIKVFEELKIPNQKQYELISKYLPLIIYEPNEIIKKIQLLLDHGATVESVIKDDWPMNFSYDKMKARLENFETEYLPSKKPWILTCSDDILHNKINISKRNQEELEKIAWIVNYLCKNSDYSKKIIEHKILSIKKDLKDLDQVQRIINIILKEGYQYHDIIWSIKVLTCSENTIISRFSLLQGIKHNQLLDILLITEEKFIEYVNSSNKNI